MSKTRIDVTINSRQYKVIANESVEYIKMLAAHIDGIVAEVLKSGQNVTGERPVVLAALNICDEYYKSVEKEEETRLRLENRVDEINELKEKLRAAEKAPSQISFDEKEAERKINEANRELETVRQKLLKSENEKKELENKFEDAKKQIAEFEEMINDTDKELNAAKKKLAEDERKISELEKLAANVTNIQETRRFNVNGGTVRANGKKY